MIIDQQKFEAIEAVAKKNRKALNLSGSTLHGILAKGDKVPFECQGNTWLRMVPGLREMGYEFSDSSGPTSDLFQALINCDESADGIHAALTRCGAALRSDAMTYHAENNQKESALLALEEIMRLTAELHHNVRDFYDQ